MSRRSYASCAVTSCNSKQDEGARFFKYSSTYYSYHEFWLTNCDISVVNKKKILICSKHFEPHFFFKRKLKKTAVPTLCLGKQVESHSVKSKLDSVVDSDNLKKFSLESSNNVQIIDHFDHSHIKTYSTVKNDSNIMTLQDIASMPDPYVSTEYKFIEDDPPTCAHCEKNEKNVEIYRNINRKLRLKIIKLEAEKKKLSKLVKSLNQKQYNLNQTNTILKSKSVATLKDLIDKQNKSVYCKKFSLMILDQRPKTQKWQDEFKTMAQNIYYRSPKTYNFMREKWDFSLPSKSSLIRWQPIKNLFPGISNSYVMEKLKDKIDSLSETAKNCTLIFDEIKIKKDLKYNVTRDCVDGYVDLGGNKREPRLGTHICVFMVRGILENWKNMISYYVSENCISSDCLTNIIKENLSLCQSLGLTIRAIVCDQGANNRSAFRKLGITKSDPTLKGSSLNSIVGIFDVPHLVKSVRNALLTSDIKTPDGIVSWNVMRAFYKLELKSVTRMCPKLTDKHIYPGHFEQMKVKLATQVFSRSVVAGLKTSYELHKFTELVKTNVLATWTFFEKMDKLFDSLNSKHLFDANKFKSALHHSDSNDVIIFLNEMITYISQIKIVSGQKVYSFDGLIQTIVGILSVSKALLKENIPYLMTWRLNQDALENTFSLIRSANGNNFSPSVQEFSFTVAKILSIKFLTSFTSLSNCEEDSDSTLLHVIREDVQNQSTGGSEELSGISNIEHYDDTENDLDGPRLEEDFISLDSSSDMNSDPATRYFAGYLVHRAIKRFNCTNCVTSLLKEADYVECSSELLIKNKNYMANCFGKLQAPSQTFFEICKRQIMIFDTIFKNESHLIGIKKKIVNFLLNNETDLEFYKTDHLCYFHRETILNLMILILIRKTCKWKMEQQKILKKNTRTTDRLWRRTLQ